MVTASDRGSLVPLPAPPILTALIATLIVQVLASNRSSTAPVAAPAIAHALGIDVRLDGSYTALLFAATVRRHWSAAR